MAVPLERTDETLFLTTNVTLNLFGAWTQLVLEDGDGSLQNNSDLVSVYFSMAQGNPSHPNRVTWEIGIGPVDPPAQNLIEINYAHPDTGQGGGHYGTFQFPFDFLAGSKFWGRVKGTEGPGGAFNYPIQLVFMNQVSP